MLIPMEPDTSSSQRPVIPASEILAKIVRGEDVEYDYKVIEGDLDLSGLDLLTEKVSRTKQELRQGLSEELKVITSEITIINSEIRGKVNFSNTHFRKTVSFREQSSFKRVQFADDVDLRGAKFDRNVTFTGVIFNYANFMRTKYTGKANFSGARFKGDVYFTESEFIGEANFLQAKFGGKARFTEVKFGGNANFLLAEFTDYAGFGVAQFGGKANFQQVTFGGMVWFLGVVFRGDTDFIETKFKGDTHFIKATFCRDNKFMDAQFGGKADFLEATFHKDADLVGAKFYADIILRRLKFNILYIDWISIKDNLVYDGPAYLALMKNFKVIEQFEDADDCEYQYRKKNQDQKKLYDNENGWDLSKFLDIISWISCGYGVRPLHTVFSMFGVVFIASIIFLGYFDSMFESIYFSLMTFTGGLMMFTGGEPDILTPERWLRTLAMIEAILGYLLMALFVVVLARKFIR
jgi:uncharacterized protein YjbI with pentapeptide repeats